MKNGKWLWLLFGMAFFSTRSSFAEESKGQHRIVVELTSKNPQAWTGVLNNVESLRKSFGEKNTVIEVVALAEGLAFLLKKGSADLPRMEKLASQGVLFAACENTMKRQSVSRSDLASFANPVDSGVSEVVRKQEAGWSYLKASE